MEKKTKVRTNPNGANQHHPDPRQSLFLSYYLNPKSKTFSNASKSAERAGFGAEYCKNITGHGTTWLSEALSNSSMLIKAEQNLVEILDLKTLVPAMGAFGPIINKKTKKPVLVQSTGLLKVKADVSKFVAEKIGRKKYGGEEETKPAVSNFTQIIINHPNGNGQTRTVDARSKPDDNAIRSVASSE